MPFTILLNIFIHFSLLIKCGYDNLLLKVTATFVAVMSIFIRGCFIDKLINMSQLQKFKGISNVQK